MSSNSSNLSLKNKSFFENSDIGLLTIEEVAGALGKAPNTIRNMIARREMPFVRIGNKNMIRKASFEAWLQRREFIPWE